MYRKIIGAGMAALPALLMVCSAADPKVPLGLPPFEWPANNPYSLEKVELGRLLYYDKRLSADESVACASCHSPQFAFTDGSAVSTGIKQQ
jgi:cytochrome c peroxidase